MIASMKPRSSITAASVTYMMPMCLWSTLVIHSLHRYGIQPLMVMNASTPMTITITIATANLTEPVVKFRRCLRHDLEMHAGKSVAAYLGCKAAKRPWLIGQEIELCPHPVHCVDHAAQLGDEECGHHTPRGQRKANRNARRDDQSVDARDMLVRIDEQPFPVERHDLNVERLFLRNETPRGVKIMRTDPGHPAKQHDGEQRNRPYDQLKRAGIFEVGQIARPGVGRSVPPRGRQGGDNGRDHDDEHDRHGIDEECRVAVGDWTFRIEHRPVAAAKEKRGAQRRQSHKPSNPTPEDHSAPPRVTPRRDRQPSTNASIGSIALGNLDSPRNLLCGSERNMTRRKGWDQACVSRGAGRTLTIASAIGARGRIREAN